MELTNRQQEGLRIALEKYKNHERYVVISGYAGSGKTTLVKFIIEALDVEEDKVAFASFTGKAAEVLRKKGNKNAMTLHRLLYDSIPRPGGGFYRKPKTTLDYDIIVVDECSMVPKSMVDMLNRHKAFIIYLGDPGQLPQIDKNEAHDLLNKPDVFLDEIMRQAQESEIIRLTMKIRNEEPIDFVKGNEVMVIPKRELVTGHLLWADQIVCATNNSRINLNKQVRQLLGYQGLPQQNEKMICLIQNPFETYINAPRYIKMKNHKIPIICCNFCSEDGQSFLNVDIDKHFIENGEPFLEWRESYALGKLKNRIGDIIPKTFDYGYAITGWKAQGSEWDKVLVIEENFPFNREEHKKFLYTCATRASKKLVLLKE